MAQITGSCLCGGVKLQVMTEPLRVGICHCMDCRKHHGSLFYAAAIFKEQDVKFDGVTNSYKGRHFCPNCGSSVFAKTEDEIEVHLGILDHPDQFEPSYECWSIRREAWLPDVQSIKSYERDRGSEDKSEQ